MAALKASALLAALACASHVAAHGHVSNIVVNGVYYENYDPTSFPYLASPPTVIGWKAGDSDNGFVAPDAFGGPDIICHKNATPGGGHATVAAGDKISIQWTPTWPDSHHGPVLDYLAACNGDCETVDKTTLQFFKIDGAGYVSGSDPGLWATDTLIADNSTWLVQIPSDLKPGNYVLRHEIIALHSAGQADGAQAYPQCVNLQVTGTGTVLPSGTYGTALYQATDPGILFNIYTSPIVYTVPGPTLIAGASSSIAQSSSVATATASATLPGGGAGATTTTTASTKAASTTSSSSVKSTSTTLNTSTTTKATTTAAPTTTGAAQTKYGQCGGSGWTGPTSCVSGSTCTVLNAYYAQCV
ncbi:glycosyl hydrolase family 61-domain-containing protein [Diplogelasinospora grovesii]|uniref:lytic cellulose monooxygenase (C4-dehydrogenating) n=1 Tax=Diplogelasinospora grovesii TaxID=303347 RepID=A0AAN6NH92_9PEZI|nr:glycosyl hydrolase family 61-domain-containing protein [Diplogelasinospora grovesii]